MMKDAVRRVGLGLVLLVAFMLTFTKAGDLISAPSNFKVFLGLMVLAAVLFNNYVRRRATLAR